MTPASCLVSESEPSLTGFRYSGRNLAEKSSVLQIFRSIVTSRSLKARVNGSDRASLVMGRVISCSLCPRSGRCQPQGGTLGMPTRGRGWVFVAEVSNERSGRFRPMPSEYPVPVPADRCRVSFLYQKGRGLFLSSSGTRGIERRPGAQPELAEFYASDGFVFFLPHRRGAGRIAGRLHYGRDSGNPWRSCRRRAITGGGK